MCGGEGNGNPLQCSCLENPRGGGAWWAAVSGVAQSRTLLKQLSSSRVCGRTESKLTVNWKQKKQQSRFLLNPGVLMLSNRLPSGVLEAVVHSEPGLEGCRNEAHRSEVTYLDDLWHCLQLWGSWLLSSVQFLLGCVWLCDPTDCSMPGFPVLYQLPELAQTHVHQVSDAIQPFHPLLSPSPPAFNLSQHQDLFQRVSSSHQVARALEFTRFAKQECQAHHPFLHCFPLTELFPEQYLSELVAVWQGNSLVVKNLPFHYRSHGFNS